MDRVGVVSYGMLPDDEVGLKRLLILYDSIWVPWLHESFPTDETVEQFDLDREHLSTLRWLAEIGILKPPEFDISSSAPDDVALALHEVLKESEAESEAVGETAYGTAEEAAIAAGAAAFNFDDAVSRLTAYLASRDHDRYVYPINRALEPDDNRPPSRIERMQSVLRVVIRELPIPSSDVALQELVDFRRDEATKYKFEQFWKWIRKAASQDIPTAEIAEELAALQVEYEHHLKQLTKKTERATLKALVVMPLTVAEDLVKVRWGNIADRIFSVAEERISAVERELSLPGSEVAFLLDAKRALTGGRRV